MRADSKMHVVWDGFSMETALGHLLQNSSPQKHRQSGIMTVLCKFFVDINLLDVWTITMSEG